MDRTELNLFGYNEPVPFYEVQNLKHQSFMFGCKLCYENWQIATARPKNYGQKSQSCIILLLILHQISHLVSEQAMSQHPAIKQDVMPYNYFSYTNSHISHMSWAEMKWDITFHFWWFTHGTHTICDEFIIASLFCASLNQKWFAITQIHNGMRCREKRICIHIYCSTSLSSLFQPLSMVRKSIKSMPNYETLR